MNIVSTLLGIQPLSIGMVMYPSFTLLDLVGPQSVLAWAGTTHLVARTMDPVTSDSGAQLVPTCTFADCPRDLDVLFVPGGFGTFDAMKDPELLAFLADRGARAGKITSVCSGAMILGAAGLLQGYRSTTHWAVHDTLVPFGAEPVKQRVVTDRNRISGGGVTAGIDFGLVLLAELHGEETARLVQLMMEYDPAPPFTAGTPEQAGPALTERALAIMAGVTPTPEATPVQSQA